MKFPTPIKIAKCSSENIEIFDENAKNVRCFGMDSLLHVHIFPMKFLSGTVYIYINNRLKFQRI